METNQGSMTPLIAVINKSAQTFLLKIPLPHHTIGSANTVDVAMVDRRLDDIAVLFIIALPFWGSILVIYLGIFKV
ncbi:MAG TPA: hypothetical protein VHG71_01160 [Verrucomicrobiae bacterium]|nr:hypothetical protein [Verrucomicrobiae bacterium]